VRQRGPQPGCCTCIAGPAIRRDLHHEKDLDLATQVLFFLARLDPDPQSARGSRAKHASGRL